MQMGSSSVVQEWVTSQKGSISAEQEGRHCRWAATQEQKWATMQICSYSRVCRSGRQCRWAATQELGWATMQMGSYSRVCRRGRQCRWAATHYSRVGVGVNADRQLLKSMQEWATMQVDSYSRVGVGDNADRQLLKSRSGQQCRQTATQEQEWATRPGQAQANFRSWARNGRTGKRACRNIELVMNCKAV